ncbi:Smr/MutS family protein [Qipengyuania sp. CAU 1752]
MSDDEASAWETLAATVDPIDPARKVNSKPRSAANSSPVVAGKPLQPGKKPAARAPDPAPSIPRTARRISAPGHLDSYWDRRLKSGEIPPDLSLDLHDHGLDAAYSRLMDGMEQAHSLGARVVLIVTGRSRPVDPADRSTKRGAIRAKILDWLAASEHGAQIAAIRKAHRRHGGEGALYVVLRRQR